MIESILYTSTVLKLGRLRVTPAEADPAQESSAQEPLGEMIFLKAGEPLYHEEEAAACLFKVAGGAIRSFTFTEDGRRQVNGLHFEGDLFGSAQFGHYRSSTEAITDCSLVRFRRDGRLGGASEAQDPLALEVALAEIHSAEQQILLLGRMSACAKVAAFLLYLAESLEQRVETGTTIALPMTRYDIADFLGLSAESVSRCVTKLRQKGLIRTPSSDRITLVDPVGLTDIPRGF